MKKIFTALAFIILLICIGLFIFVFVTGPSLPPGTDAVIKQVIDSDPVDELPGDTGYAVSSGVKIWYKTLKPSGVSKGDILLIEGIAADSLWWPRCFLKSLTDSGYRVILFDNRGTGMSDWMTGLEDSRYRLENMAEDSAAVLDTLHIKKAHVAGVSMGGMVAQQMAISFPGRVSSLISIMSSGYLDDPELPHIPWGTVKNIVRISLRYGLIKSETNIVKLHLSMWELFRNEPLSASDMKSISERVVYNIRKRRGYNPLSLPQQMAAIRYSGSRYGGLGNLENPMLVIHGRRDPLIPYGHGVKCSQLVPGSSLVLVDGMGHDISCSRSGLISKQIVDFISAQNNR